jgi:hypothetical protein
MSEDYQAEVTKDGLFVDESAQDRSGEQLWMDVLRRIAAVKVRTEYRFLQFNSR